MKEKSTFVGNINLGSFSRNQFLILEELIEVEGNSRHGYIINNSYYKGQESFDLVQNMLKNTPEALSPTTVSKAICNEIKYFNGFNKAEDLYDIFIQLLKKKKRLQTKLYLH